ncbi:response regulator containing CheY-like receiver domain and AraC-type DNA-binding domain [Desulfosporosinus orientis DSM 765]|uniref:Stage 0 sporulation protein A homolog n=1 Tax=Desulfosporosinus orientis (strain ATCC 19365 / DSM 765 / NCIMB 8382 / VKM B-1628 / Singapore I) TaxID=768706 RepID=G7WG86_DESOD|nr:response regulator [Desulfosporosinus orientis]AET70818.1 response regulator containing CheY-like receiver domain and AraC-type DNA-binding domain [Desulfosporosinus orientis DSM 765]
MLRIIIADDELPIREWLNYCLKDKKISLEIVGTVADGLQAYELAVKEKPDVVILDIRMPKMDGITAMKNIQKVLPETEFVILTNYADFSYAKQAISCGAKEYILKSELRSSELIEILAKIEKDRYTQQDRQRIADQMEQARSKTLTEYSGNSIDNNKFIKMALNYIHEHFNDSISLAEVASQVYRSPEYFSRLFKEVTGENFSIYLINYRLTQAKKLLTETTLKITDISYRVGYQNPSYFSRLYKKYMGITPEDERRKNWNKAK